MSHPLLHHVLSFSAQNVNACYVLPRLRWDLKHPPVFAQFATDPIQRIPSNILDSFATSPPVSLFTIECGLFPSLDWLIEVEKPDGVTVKDVLSGLYKSLRRRITPNEYALVPETQRKRIADSFYRRVRESPDPSHEQGRGVRRVDWLLKHTVFVGLTPSPEGPLTWTLTTKIPPKLASSGS